MFDDHLSELGVFGGLTEARKVAGWCETHQIRLATHNPLGPISAAACLHLNLATPNVGVAEQIRPVRRRVGRLHRKSLQRLTDSGGLDGPTIRQLCRQD